MPKAPGTFSPAGGLRAAHDTSRTSAAAPGSPAERAAMHGSGGSTSAGIGGGRALHDGGDVAVLLRREASDADGRSESRRPRHAGAPLFWSDEQLEHGVGHPIVDRMHHQRIGTDVCEYNTQASIDAVRSSGPETVPGGPPSHIEKVKSFHDRRNVARKQVMREFGQSLRDQVQDNSTRREEAWLAWVEQQQAAVAAAGRAPTLPDSTEPSDDNDEDDEDDDEEAEVRLTHFDPKYFGQRPDGRTGLPPAGRPRPAAWPESFDPPAGLGPTSSDPQDYAVDLAGGFDEGFASLEAGLSEVDSIVSELWDDVHGGSAGREARPEEGEPPARAEPAPAQPAAKPRPQATVTARREQGEAPRGSVRSAVWSENAARRRDAQQRDRGSHKVVGEGAIAPAMAGDQPEQRQRSSFKQVRTCL